MIRFICECNDEIKELQKATIKVIDGKVRTVEAVCSCGKYMQELDKEFNGFPNLIRTEPTLSNRRDKVPICRQRPKTLFFNRIAACLVTYSWITETKDLRLIVMRLPTAYSQLITTVSIHRIYTPLLIRHSAVRPF